MISKITPSEKKKLKERLRKLDKQLKYLYWYTSSSSRNANIKIFPDEYIKLKKLDEKRKEIRNKLK